MYYPYLRGKQNELLALRECSKIIAKAGFVPIVEPVKKESKPLIKALQALCADNAKAVVIANPRVGDMKGSSDELIGQLKAEFAGSSNVGLGWLISNDMSLASLKSQMAKFGAVPSALIHHSSNEAKGIAEYHSNAGILDNVFLEKSVGTTYPANFKINRAHVLIRDGFTSQERGSDYDQYPEFYSDLHVTFRSLKMNGFGDYLTIGTKYSKGGGPARTVVIHLTYIDRDNEDKMYVQHFVSDRQDTTEDTPGKFYEALGKLIKAVDQNPSKYIESSAIAEFRQLYADERFPNLGYVKKLSIKHHIETYAAYFESNLG